MSSDRDVIIDELVNANRILGHEGILDAFGHVSIRDPDNPEHYLLSRARSPEVIERPDILEFEYDGSPVEPTEAALYNERYIHGAIYEARPDITAVCHNHTLSILPFSISTDVKLQAVIHIARFLGTSVPVWDIATEFGTNTNMLVRDMPKARSLAQTLDSGAVTLMRGHGSVLVSNDVVELVAMCVAMDRNAKVLLDASRLGGYQPLEEGEITPPNLRVGRGDNRGWEYFLKRAGLI